jgi:Tol biopolymer transport system component
MDISPDGKWIIAVRGTVGGGLIEIPLESERKDRQFAAAPFFEDHPQFSPNGKWVAYDSAETSPRQVYIQSYPAGAGKWQVSRDGGTQPFWRGDGKELYFISQGREVVACDIRPKGTGLEVGAAKVLFQARFESGGSAANFAATRDGQRFVINTPSNDGGEQGLRVIVNWRPPGGRTGN